MGEKIRKAVCSNVFEGGEKQPLGFVSVSVGVAECRSNNEDITEFISRFLLKKIDK